MTGVADPVRDVVAAGPVAVAVALAAIALAVTGVALTIHTHPRTSAGVLAAGVAVLGLLAVAG